MKQALAAAFAAIFLLIVSPGTCPASDKAQVLRSMRDCAAAIRKIPANNAKFKIPKPCAEASKKFRVEDESGASRPIDNLWITADLKDIRKEFEDDCPGCNKKPSKEKKEKKQKEKKKDKEKEAPCVTCQDAFGDFDTRAQALTQIAETIEAAADAAGEKPISRQKLDNAHAAAADVLSRKEFKWKTEKKKPGFSEHPIIKKIREWIRKHLPEPKTPKKTAPHMVPQGKGVPMDTLWKSLVATLLISMVALVIALLIIKYKKISSSEASVDEEESQEPAAKAAALLEEAEKLRRQGQYRLAIRSRFLAFLRLLEQRGLVIFIANKTNREYLAELRRKKSVGQEIEKMNRLFETAWYGMKDCSEDDYTEFLSAYETGRKEMSK